MSIGALIPDLDREYLFVAKNFIGKHQLHRSLFHNIFITGLLYLANPFLALGALSHSLLDAFTSATDRGVELLFPLTRLVRGYYYNIEGEKTDSDKKMEWWVEDPWRLLQQTTDRDLQEPKEQSWRRSYGPFRNSRIVDWGMFFSALAFICVSILAFGSSFYSFTDFRILSIISIIGIAVFYGLGEWYRRKLINEKPETTNLLVLGILVVGLIVFFAGGFFGGIFLLQPASIPSLDLIVTALASIIVGFVISYFLVKARRRQDIAL
jgi:uncharacterized membrane protein YidH (DUF202 family)